MRAFARRAFFLLPMLALLAAGCAREQTAARCLDHYQTDFGNQTRYGPCPAEYPHSPWMQRNR